jgi:hypothetical protein
MDLCNPRLREDDFRMFSGLGRLYCGNFKHVSKIAENAK